MPETGFMEKTYQGVLDEQVLRSLEVVADREKIRRVTEGYEGLLKEFPPPALEARGRVPQEMLRKMADLGLFGLSIPESYGGMGLNLFEYLETIKELVEPDLSVALVSIAHLSIGIKGIHLFGTEEQKRKYLVPAASGEMIFSYALTEPRVGSDAKHIETQAALSQDETHYVLNGQKTYITNANYAGALTVFAQLDPANPGHMGAFIVETSWEGVKIGEDMPKMGLKASSTAAIQFKDVRVPRENLLGRPGDGFKIAMTILNFGRLGLGAASVGHMERAVEDMARRARSRFQFGVPIEDFPLIQEKIARARVHAFASDAMNTLTASLLEQDPHRNVAIETSHCKLFGTTRAWDTLYDALQVAGGSGYLATQPYEKRVRDFRVTTIFEGTTEIHSIYPPLFALRRMSRRLDAAGQGRFAVLKFYWKQLTRRMQWPLKPSDRSLKKALRLAKANARSIRWLLLAGSLWHGKNMPRQEFLLRRITHLSVTAYALLAAVARLLPDAERGALREEHRILLEALIAEAREIRRANRRFFDSCRERKVPGVLEVVRREVP